MYENRFWIMVVLSMAVLPSASAYINVDAINNADTYVRSGQNTTNYGSDAALGIYGSGAKMNTIMNWTLPSGDEDITEIALTLYCQNWDNFPATPVELHVLNEPFEQYNATWSKRKSSTDWTNTGAEAPISMNSTVVDSIHVDSEGFYTWVLRGPDASNRLDSLSWGDTINIALTLPDETGFRGIQCYSKEWYYNQPYMVVTNEVPAAPHIIDVTTASVRKTSALIRTITDTPTVNVIVNYGTNSSDLNLWSYADSLSDTSYNLLKSLTPNTTYYYRVYASNYIDNTYKIDSPLLSFTTDPDGSYIPLVTFVFDDGWKSTVDASHILNDSLFSGVSAIVTDMPDISPAYMNWTQIQELQNTYGWEIASHTTSHADMSTLNKSRLESELGDSKTALTDKGLDVYNFISPYGAYNYLTEAYVMRYYDSDRIVSDGPIAPPYDEFPLYARHIQNTTTLSEVKEWVDSAIINNSWLILVLHRIVDSNPMAEEWTGDDLASLAQYIESKGELRVVTIREAQTTSFDYKGIYASTATRRIVNTVYPDGTVDYSKTATGHPGINATVLPSSDPVAVDITLWNKAGDYKIQFNESSTNASNEVRYILGDIKANAKYSVKVYWSNGTLFQDLYINSNESGYLSYNTTGFENPRYTVIQQTALVPSYMAIAIVAMVIIGGIAFILIARLKI
ncbi:putative xylanase/chitin deacetylase [Candidatus Methanoperedens nitroreducens]|uniref:Putative xylanase/chitin deacetylase n=2 Tax=Candidatus Methanoperedens nitratireducens TaxID=1392998 RepID=A0A062V3A0_9EURY|nr:putative xylanase/chitin deacetylase [Candidatus Methanoperedens nitroreducens]MDJ1422489.1 DNRLRE domain-containing protein [Candidatus Methanoperedens sp.]